MPSVLRNIVNAQDRAVREHKIIETGALELAGRSVCLLRAVGNLAGAILSIPIAAVVAAVGLLALAASPVCGVLNSPEAFVTTASLGGCLIALSPAIVIDGVVHGVTGAVMDIAGMVLSPHITAAYESSSDEEDLIDRLQELFVSHC